MRLGTLLLIVVPLTVLAWWLFNEDPEQEVRTAHSELVRLAGKSAEDTSSRSILNARAFQSLFADSLVINGDAGSFVDTYSPEQIFGTVSAVQARFRSIQVTLGELTIVFPTSDEASARFVATLEARRAPQDTRSNTIETRNVVSRMRKIDGNWLFTEFQLTDY